MANDKDESSWVLKLEDRLSGPATTSARALQTLRERIDADTRALRAMQASLSRLKAGGQGASAAAKDLAERIKAGRAEVASAEKRFLSLGGTFGGTASAASHAGGGIAELAAAARGSGGPLGALSGRVSGLVELLGGGLVGASVAVAAALLAVGAAAAAAAVSLLAYGVASASARRDELLHLEGITTLRRGFGLARESGSELQAQIDRVSDSSALGRSEVAGYAEQLYRMGLRGRNAEAALDAVTLAATVQGRAGAARTASWAAGLARTGGDVQRLASLVRSRLGGIAERQLYSLDVQTRKLHERLDALFRGLRIEGFLRALGGVTDLLSQSTASGQALRVMLEAVFNPLLDAAGQGGPVVRRFFQGMILGAQQVVIALLEVRSWFHRTFGKDALSQLDGTTAALEGGKVALFAIVGVLGAAAIVAVALGAGLALAAASAALLALPFVALAAAVVYAGLKLGELYQAVTSYDWAAAGRSLVDGLVRGVESGRDRVVGAVRSLAADARSTLADALGIHSPSRVFADLGRQSARGYAAGLEDGGGDVGSAAGDMGRAAVAAGSTIRGGDRSVTINELHVHAPDGSADGLVDKLREALGSILEGSAIEMGAEEPST